MNMIEGHRAMDCPAGVEPWDVDPYDPAVQTAPTAFYDELRRRGPFVYLSRYGMLACGRYAETREVFSDHDRFVSSRGVGLQDFQLEKPWRPPSIVLEVDPPEHARARRVLMRALSPKAVAGLREVFLAEADALIGAAAQTGRIEAVTALAETFPTTVFPKAMGLLTVDRQVLIDYGAMVFNALGPDNATRRAAMARAPDIVPRIADQCQRDNLDPNGMAMTIYHAADAGDITSEEAALLVRSLLSAGVDTTVTGIGNALWCLSQNPGQYALLRADPGLAGAAFEETLRVTSPVSAFCRTAGADTMVSGVDIPEGAKILCVLGAANLDPDHWPEADRFDITRKTAGHLAMGAGIHSCVGQNIARAEGQAFLSALARQIERIEPDGPATWRPNNAMHALDTLPLDLNPA